MMSQDTVTNHFQKRKNVQISSNVGKTRSAAKKQEHAEPTIRTSAPNEAEFSRDEQILRAFDLTSKYGPCTGMTRMERWERAVKLGLEPPMEVPLILNKYGPQAVANNNLWHNRI